MDGRFSKYNQDLPATIESNVTFNRELILFESSPLCRQVNYTAGYVIINSFCATVSEGLEVYEKIEKFSTHY